MKLKLQILFTLILFIACSDSTYTYISEEPKVITDCMESRNLETCQEIVDLSNTIFEEIESRQVEGMTLDTNAAFEMHRLVKCMEDCMYAN